MFLGDKPPEGDARPWRGSCPVQDDLIIFAGVRLTAARRLAVATKRRLRSYRHFVIPSDDE